MSKLKIVQASDVKWRNPADARDVFCVVSDGGSPLFESTDAGRCVAFVSGFKKGLQVTPPAPIALL